MKSSVLHVLGYFLSVFQENYTLKSIEFQKFPRDYDRAQPRIRIALEHSKGERSMRQTHKGCKP